jgi:hypothetical protein
MAASETNFRAPLDGVNAGIGSYLAAATQLQSKCGNAQTKSSHNALVAVKAIIDALVATSLVNRATTEVETVALDIASGAIGADSKIVGSTVVMLDDRTELLANAQKALDEAVKAFGAELSAAAAAAAKAKESVTPKKK